jgi:aconitate decarboxylase
MQTRQPPTSPDGPTGRVAEWVASFDLSQVPPEVTSRAKHLLLDGAACALVGARLPWSTTAADAVLGFEGQGSAPVIGWGRTTSLPAATLLNSTFIQGFELDDFHPFAPLHSASLLLPALLSASVHSPSIDGRRFLAASIAGFEIGPRVGLALHGGEMLSRGWHSGPVFGPISTAAAVANALELDPGAVEDALGLGATQACGLMAAQFESMGKRMQHGLAARNGLYAALLANGGYTGIKQVFETPYGGYLSTFGEGHNPDPTQIDSQLGERWETSRIVIKPYAAMAGLHAAIDAVFDIASQRALLPDDIMSIEVELGHSVYHHGWWPPERPLSATGAQMNVAYSIAVAIIDGAALIRQFSPERINSDDVWDLIPKITAIHNPDFDREAIGRGQTRLRVTFADGTVTESYQFAAKSVLSPLTNEEVIAKDQTLLDQVISPGRAEKLQQFLLSIEQQPDLAELRALLVQPARSPFHARTTP